MLAFCCALCYNIAVTNCYTLVVALNSEKLYTVYTVTKQ
jgi:hypothetical protein